MWWKQYHQIATASHKISTCKLLLASLSCTVFNVDWLHIHQIIISINWWFFKFLLHYAFYGSTLDWNWCYVATKFLIRSEYLYVCCVCQNLVHSFFIHLFKKPLRVLNVDCRAHLQKLKVCSEGQEISHILWNPEVQYYLCKRRLLNNESFKTIEIEKQSNILDIPILVK